MPTSRPSLLPSSVIGTPEMRYFCIRSSASKMRLRRRERDRVDDHAALGPLHAIDFRRLFLDRQVLVDDAEAAVLRHRDRQADSVTVSIAALTSGTFSRMLRVSRVTTSTCVGSTVECCGTSRTSSKVSAVAMSAVRPKASASGFQFHGSLAVQIREGPTSVGLVFVTRRRRGTSCISCRCRTGTGRCGRPSARRGARS